MNIAKRILICALASLALSTVLPSCSKSTDTDSDWKPNDMNTNVTSDSLYVKKVENLPDDFIMGMDASCVPALEASGVKYFDHSRYEHECNLHHFR